MKELDVLILVDSGIGNAIQALYSIEYCLQNKVKAGIYLSRINLSFQNYLKECYGTEIILESMKEYSVKNLIHSFTFQEEITVSFAHYFFIKPDFHSTKLLSETEQMLSVVKALFPSNNNSNKKTLDFLKENYSTTVGDLGVENKYVFYPGGSPINSARRWPWFPELEKIIGAHQVIFIGGKEDLNFNYSYAYPDYFRFLFSQKVLNNKKFWEVLKKIGLLESFSHLTNLGTKDNCFIEKFSWAELVAIFRRCKKFIGNDGGLMHLAGAAGASGFGLFGPTSVMKNKPLNPGIQPLSKSYPCEPCQFGVGNVQMVNYFINCPYGIKCLKAIKPDEVSRLIND